MENIIGTDRVREREREILQRVKEENNILKKRRNFTEFIAS